MKIPALTDTIAQAVADLFDADRRPAHSDLDRLFERAGLSGSDPKRVHPELMIGKRRRVAAVLAHALDHDRGAGARLVVQLLASIRGVGGFRPDSSDFVGETCVRNARDAFHEKGFDLDPNGTLRPLFLDNLDGTDLTEALRIYVRRARAGAGDAALVTGTGKDILEASARHVLLERTGVCDEKMNFPMTLYHAFYAQDLATPPGDVIEAWEKKLDLDPRKRLAQTLYLVGLAVNKLRNSEGTGHGRPFLPAVTDLEAKIAIEAMGVVSEFVLEKRAP